MVVSVADGQPGAGLPSEPGKCYAKCLIPELYESEVEYEHFYRYRGDEPFQKGVEEVTFVVKEAGTKWEKKIREKNCISEDPEDCLVWCIIKTPEETEAYFEVVDTHTIKDFVLDSVEFQSPRLIQPGGFTEWREIVCETDITSEFYTQVQEALQAQGFDIGPNGADGKVSQYTKAALVQFQKKNGYPIGAFDYDTLAGLGISR